MSVLVLTYHAIEPGPAPLFVAPRLFAAHLDAIAASGARTLTVSEVAAGLRAGTLPERGVALTFDDGFASVARTAAPLLAERGMAATVFCVAGHLGGRNDWPTQPGRVPVRPLADADDVRRLAQAGLEIGSHGTVHAPLDAIDAAGARREVVDSRAALEQASGTAVRVFASPYGLRPAPAVRELVAETYDAACAGWIGRVAPGADPHDLPRLDVHYVRRPALLRRAAAGGLGPYFVLRRTGARIRRLAWSDHAGG